MIHYHGTPITPRTELLRLAGRNFCVSFACPKQVEVCHEIGQSVMLDNGAFTFWRSSQRPDWDGYYEWCYRWLEYRTTWAVIPDVIDGGEDENDRLIEDWPWGDRGAPVWHMHEPLDRLLRLCDPYRDGWSRVCIGSSGEYATVGDQRWHARMHEAMDALCGDGPVPCWLHMLRGLRFAGSDYPFASADSTSIAQNHAGNNTRGAPRKDVVKMADSLDSRQCASRWQRRHEQVEMGV